MSDYTEDAVELVDRLESENRKLRALNAMLLGTLKEIAAHESLPIACHEFAMEIIADAEVRKV